MPIAAIALPLAASAIGAAVSGGSKSSSTQASTQTQQVDSSHTPWAPQGTQIENALNQAGQVYSDRQSYGNYGGDLYTGLNAAQTGAANQAGGFGLGSGINGANQSMGVGQQGATALGQSVDAAKSVAGGIGPANSTLTGVLQDYATGAKTAGDPNLSAALNSSAVAGANSISDYNAGLKSAMTTASGNATDGIISDASKYVNSSATQSMLDNAYNQIDTTLNETTNPGLNRAAAMGGNLNSSRAGMAEAMANRDAALAKGNVAAQINNNAFNTGVSTANASRTSNLNAATAAASAGLSGNANLALGTGNQSLANAQLAVSAAGQGLSQDTARDSADASAKLGASGALNNAANTGVNATTAGINQATASSNLAGAAGQLYQQDANAQNAADLAAWNMKDQREQGLLTDYMGTITKPSGYYQASQGSTATTNAAATPVSPMGSLIAGGGTALGSQFASGGAFNSTNADGTANKNYVGPISTWFGGGNTTQATQMASPFDAAGYGA